MGYLYAKIYYFYRTAMMRTVRSLVFFFLVVWASSEFRDISAVRFPIFLLYFFILIESYFRFRVAKYIPAVTIDKNLDSNPYSTCTMQVLYACIVRKDIVSVIEDIVRLPQACSILYKSNIEITELQKVSVEKDEVIRYAYQLAKSLQGKFITTMDVLTAYLLLIEPQTRTLFSKNIKPEELMHILQWARLDFPHEETPKKFRIHFDGGGLGEALVTGWTPETKKYTFDFTYTALQKKPLLMGRAGEYHQMVEAISKSENNNVLLVGDIGSGKETLVEALAYESFTGNVPSGLQDKHFFELMLGQLIAGATDRNDLELRLQAVIEEVSHARNVIIYIPEFQNIMGVGSYDINLSGALLPYLKNGRIPIIATVTAGNYKAYIEEDAIKEAFEVIKLYPPTKEIAIQMLLEKAWEVEYQNNIIITYKAIVAAGEYADRYAKEMVLPGSGAQLLQDAAHAVAMEKTARKLHKTGKKILLDEDVIGKIEEKTNIAIAQPKGEERKLLLHLEEKLHERIVDQVEAVTVIAEAMRRVRSGLAASNKPISFLFLGPTGVGKTETAKALSELYFGGESNMIRLDMSEYTGEDGAKRLLGAPPGEGLEKGELTEKVYDNPYSLILLDEFEKADAKILDLFLQVLEDGRLTDNKGRTVSFINTLIIATSNAGSEFIREEIAKGVTVDKAFEERLLNVLQTQGLFRPELLNRFDSVVTFKPLSPSDIQAITKLLLKKVAATMKEQDITVMFDERIITKVAKEGFDQQFGARPIRRYIQDQIEDLLARRKLSEQIQRGNVVTLSTDAQDAIVALVS